MGVLQALRRLPPGETAILVLAVAVLVGVGLLRAPADDATRIPLDSYSSFDAATGGYRAMYALLEREDVHVDRFEQRPALLDRELDTLVYVEPLPYDPRQVVPTTGDVASLEAWVRGGGRLLYVGHDDEAAKRGILGLPPSVPAGSGGRIFVAPALAAQGVRTIAPAANGSAGPGTRRWKPKRGQTLLLADARGPLAVTYPFGRGRVTALVDEGLFRNDAIARPDNARLAYALARPARPGGDVAFYETAHGYLLPSRWWTLVPRAFAIALCIAIAAILIAIAGAAVRFGPPLVPVDRRDRSSADFIDALSTLLERGGARGKALADARASTTRAIARSVGVADDAPLPEIAARIDRPESRDAYRSLAILAERVDPDAVHFVRGVALAQHLRKEFAAHGRPRS